MTPLYGNHANGMYQYQFELDENVPLSLQDYQIFDPNYADGGGKQQKIGEEDSW